MLRLLNKKGQNTAEYAILIGVIVAAVIAMQVYVRRGMQARMKDAVDYSKTADTSGMFNTTQYEPYYMQDSTFQTEQTTSGYESMEKGGAMAGSISNEHVSRSGVEYVGNEAGHITY